MENQEKIMYYVKVGDDNVEIIYDDNMLITQYFSLKDFCELSKEYNDNYASGVSFLDRRIFKEVDQFLIVQEKFVELMRVFLKIHI
ncbi:MAG: hypothetical protein MR739_09235 [Spirochaetia bacterium]|nr:hypothetical protein [Spirochaetia bacterium]